MMQITQRTSSDMAAAASVTLPIDKRVKSRLRVTLDDGREAGIILDRGDCLQHGDKLLSTEGDVVEVVAATETVSMVCCEDPLLFARACYHLGNRHVPIQIEVFDTTVADVLVNGKVSYLHDHVLDDMLRGLGLEVEVTSATFNPEPGAYGGGHRHDHDN